MILWLSSDVIFSLKSAIEMEGNRDESDRCINLAEDYIKRGLNDKAKKFLHKAERLYPSKRAKGRNAFCDFCVSCKSRPDYQVWRKLMKVYSRSLR